ncbi:MAG: acyl--CoA ligase [Rhodobacteraceae bacterium]|nr:acyl--CoA ligase [Paracoccaceae bacterium]
MTALSLYDQGPFAPCPEPFNLAAYVLSAGRAVPDKTALEILAPRCSPERWSYRRLDQAVHATAGGLQAMGLAKGAVILMRLGNSVDFPILYLGAILGGFVPVPTSSQLTAGETRALIDDLSPDLVAFGQGCEVLDNLTCPRLLPDQVAALQQHPPGRTDLGDPGRVAYMIYTSGTSGRPRAVMHAHRAIWARRMMWQGWLGINADDRLLHAGAFNWTYTLGVGLMDPWANGATALIPGDGVSSAELAGLLAKHRATLFAAAPGIYRQMLKPGDLPHMPNLRHAIAAGEKLPPSLAESWRRLTGTHIYESLGMSECSTFISTAPPGPPRPGTTGKPQPGRRIAVLNTDDHCPVPLGQAGVLGIANHDPGLMLGYRGQPEETARKFAGEWFVTGDMVTMDAEGWITYLGRDDDMMNAGGYRVSPIEVETALNRHPAIIEAAAVSVEVKPGVEVIAAFYVADKALSDGILAAYCAENLARYKCPRLFVPLASLPKGANNKLRRGELRRQYQQIQQKEVGHDPA